MFHIAKSVVCKNSYFPHFLIAGYFVAVHPSIKTMIDFETLKDQKDFYEVTHLLYHLKPKDATTEHIAKILSENTGLLKECLVFVHHGKSKHVNAWSIVELLQSNGQLTEVGPERNEVNYVIPNGDLHFGLKGQIVRIFRTS